MPKMSLYGLSSKSKSFFYTGKKETSRNQIERTNQFLKYSKCKGKETKRQELLLGDETRRFGRKRKRRKIFCTAHAAPIILF